MDFSHALESLIGSQEVQGDGDVGRVGFVVGHHGLLWRLLLPPQEPLMTSHATRHMTNQPLRGEG